MAFVGGGEFKCFYNSIYAWLLSALSVIGIGYAQRPNSRYSLGQLYRRSCPLRAELIFEGWPEIIPMRCGPITAGS